MENALPAIPAKRYFTIGEVSVLCGVKPYVLRYWEQEFTQLKPVKRRGNRRYYQHHEVLLIRRIRELLYDQGFTISGARNRLAEQGPGARLPRANGEAMTAVERGAEVMTDEAPDEGVDVTVEVVSDNELPLPDVSEVDLAQLRIELLSIRKLLAG
jgi:DNA-binding transcriptional MerR regulator